MSNEQVEERLELCQTAAGEVIPLARLPIGEEASVALIHTARHAYLQRLGALGLAPGRIIRLRQTQPAIVIQLGETELTLDDQAGREIFVRRRPAPSTDVTAVNHSLQQ